MEQHGESVNVDGLIHVVCLPFNITATKREQSVSLDDISESLKGSRWQEGSTPFADSTDAWNQLRQYQARAFFHPFVRRFLYNEKLVKRFHRKDIKRIEVELDSRITRDFVVDLEVHRCELVLFQPRIGILLLETSPHEPMTVQQVQLFLDTFRRLYPPYVDKFQIDNAPIWSGGHCPVEVTLRGEAGEVIGTKGTYRDTSPEFMEQYQEVLLGETPDMRPAYPWAGHWRTMLEPFVCHGASGGRFRAQQLGDDRAPVFSWIAFDEPRSVRCGDWMRLSFADPPGDDSLPNARAFSREFEERYCYDRFWYREHESTDSPSRILNCGYAFCFAGSSKDADFFANEKNGAHAIFRHIYIEMGLIAHFQKAALLSSSQLLSEMVYREGSRIRLPASSEVRDYYDHFVEFTQNFWFDEITPQEQGRELFQRWREHLRIPDLYDEVRRELKDLVDYSELRAADRLNQVVLFIGAVGLVVTTLSLVAGIFGMNNPEDSTWLPDWIAHLTHNRFSQIGIIFAAMTFAAMAGLLSYKFLRRARVPGQIRDIFKLGIGRLYAAYKDRSS